MTPSSRKKFKQNCQTHLKRLKLKGLQPKTIEAYSPAMRRIGEYFDYQINELSEQQLIDYFTDLLDSHSRSTVKLDLYGLKFFYIHVLPKGFRRARNFGFLHPNSKRLIGLLQYLLRLGSKQT